MNSTTVVVAAASHLIGSIPDPLDLERRSLVGRFRAADPTRRARALSPVAAVGGAGLIVRWRRRRWLRIQGSDATGPLDGRRRRRRRRCRSHSPKQPLGGNVTINGTLSPPIGKAAPASVVDDALTEPFD